MAIHFLASKAADFGYPAADDITTAGAFRSTVADSAVVRNNNQTGPTLPVNPNLPGNNVWFHFDASVANSGNWRSSGSDGYWLDITCDQNCFIRGDVSNGSFSWIISGFANLSSPIQSVWHTIPFSGANLSPSTIDINVIINDGSGNDVVNVYYDGALSYTVQRGNSGATRVVALTFANNDINTDVYFSQMIVADETTVGMRSIRMSPNAAGTENAWTGDFNDVLEIGDGNAISALTGGLRQNWNLEDYIGPATPSSVRGLFAQSRASVGPNGGPTGFQHTLEIGGVDYDSATILNPNFAATGITEWANNPATSLPWDTADLNALIAGVESVT